MKTLEEIIEPYKELLKTTNHKKVNNGNLNPDTYLFQKWHERITPKWYGFSLGKDVPFIWATIIDKFLEEVEKECPDFEIHQIKLKFSSVRCYLELNLTDKKKAKFVNDQIDKLELLLQNNALYY